MRREVTADAFGRLLEALDGDRDRAGERYETLRHALTRFFEWRGAPFPEDHVDETFDRVSRKLGAGLEVSNIGGYCYEVARLVCLEALKGHHTKSIPVEMVASWTPTAQDETTDLERRLECLETCLRALPQESRELILEYYSDEGRRRIDRRKAFAARLGVPRETLANRAQRVRDRLERCVSDCVSRPQAI